MSVITDVGYQVSAGVLGINLEEAHSAGEQVAGQGAAIAGLAGGLWPSECNGFPLTTSALLELKQAWSSSLAEAGAALRSLSGFTATTANAFRTAGG